MVDEAGGNKGMQPGRASTKARVLKRVRQVHLYIGVFIAPALLFFAFTGAVQTLSLHEAAGDSYAPPSWLERMGQLHKNQNTHLRKRRASKPVPSAAAPIAAPTASAAPPASRPEAPEPGLAAKERQHLPEKIFFLLVCLGLFTSTLTGIFMAYMYDRGKLLLTALLVAGIAIPLLLLPF